MKLAVIGTGNMGQALLNGMLKGAKLSPEDVSLYDVDLGKAKQVAEQTGCAAASTPSEAVLQATHVLIAVKPQYFQQAVASFVGSLEPTAIVISIAASVELAYIRTLVGDSVGIARVFPNTPALVGSGVSAVTFDNMEDAEQQLVIALMESCGIVIPCDEKTLDAIGTVSSTGPAWIMLFAEALADGGVLAGLPRTIAMEIVAATIEGSGRLLMETGLHPAILKDQVCSPGGITIEGIRQLERHGLRSAVIEAVAASMDKAKRLADHD